MAGFVAGVDVDQGSDLVRPRRVDVGTRPMPFGARVIAAAWARSSPLGARDMTSVTRATLVLVLAGPPACPGPMAKGASRAAENTPSEPHTARIMRIVRTRPFSSLRPSLWCPMWRMSSSLSSGLSSSPRGQTLNRTTLATPLPGVVVVVVSTAARRPVC